MRAASSGVADSLTGPIRNRHTFLPLTSASSSCARAIAAPCNIDSARSALRWLPKLATCKVTWSPLASTADAGGAGAADGPGAEGVDHGHRRERGGAELGDDAQQEQQVQVAGRVGHHGGQRLRAAALLADEVLDRHPRDPGQGAVHRDQQRREDDQDEGPDQQTDVGAGH